MNFQEFKVWIECHRYLSVVLIVMFCLSIVFTMLDYWQKFYELVIPDRSFKIVRLDISIRNSVYYEWDKLPEKSKKKAMKTQFDDQKYRQFRYDEGFVDYFGRSPGRGLLTAFLIIQYASSRLQLPDEVQ